MQSLALYFWLDFTMLQLLPKESACIFPICSILYKSDAISSFKQVNPIYLLLLIQPVVSRHFMSSFVGTLLNMNSKSQDVIHFLKA